jgi:predicted GNAT family acetyltransferase
VDVEVVDDATVFLEHAAPLLSRDEARNNLAYGIVSTVIGHPNVYPVFHGWLVRRGGTAVGAALRTPPLGLVLAQPNDGSALRAIADAIEDDLPGVVGAVPEVDELAAHWAGRRGARTTTLVEQRIYALTRLVPPSPIAGATRIATGEDRALVLDWMRAFAAEVLHGGEDDEGRLERSVAARLAGDADTGVGLWTVDGEPVSLAGWGGPTPNGIRIGPVYTPPELRGRGYGSAVTAAVTERALDRGRRFCFLYTDLANPTSNAIYRRLGYEPVCDSREIAFVAG